jgi:hypothetical protein
MGYRLRGVGPAWFERASLAASWGDVWRRRESHKEGGAESREVGTIRIGHTEPTRGEVPDGMPRHGSPCASIDIVGDPIHSHAVIFGTLSVYMRVSGIAWKIFTKRVLRRRCACSAVRAP